MSIYDVVECPYCGHEHDMDTTKNSTGHGFTVADDGAYIRIRDIVSIEKCVLPEYMF